MCALLDPFQAGCSTRNEQSLDSSFLECYYLLIIKNAFSWVECQLPFNFFLPLGSLSPSFCSSAPILSFLLCSFCCSSTQRCLGTHCWKGCDCHCIWADATVFIRYLSPPLLQVYSFLISLRGMIINDPLVARRLMNWGLLSLRGWGLREWGERETVSKYVFCTKLPKIKLAHFPPWL